MQTMPAVNGSNLKLPGMREPFRRLAHLSLSATGVMAGCGVAGYGSGIARPVRIPDGRA
ncbi:MAG: hypothetical protein KGL70_07910 [Betaproteobacteria bacterium]|nr:hypothetical protein [Betaproteobacteria bacterium]MDE2002580.1 hypothetical protein [Betaproteobacteria bacterium]MDE2208302.1 hypothetical protein [Betaproteobacteria bacterium]MDE2359295.1 hypothetical protein [Betaproteobacteria bacterium]